ncbi:HEAT repeat protein [Anatilimnocola aggregata]|uniref:HEAT repeat protein n=1 Tax=Anatilimnocola aggregata TaxID=2528021 RepID=A0A517Y7A5_9BACT|nr:HEAT repeat domain-containing protein [Anatilimnocola aggregata]QDU26120.1 HEAT repeat protein [Anatilimnocola aggregata]
MLSAYCQWLLVSLFVAGLVASLGCRGDVDPEAETLQQLQKGSADQRWTAALSICEMRPVPESHIKPLITALNDEDLRVRLAAARALGETGIAGQKHVNEFVDAYTHHPDPQVKSVLQQSIDKLNESR